MKRKSAAPIEEIESRSRPPDAFCEWWYPSGEDTVSGASVGGHPDAERTWARKDDHGWTRRHYGTHAAQAWLAANYREEYDIWKSLGCPEPDEPFVSIAAPIDQQKEFWRGLHTELSKINKPMPRTHLQVRNQLRGDQSKEEKNGVTPIDF
jgi:hypothetical protein